MLRWVLMASPPRTGFADMRFKPTRDSSGIEVPLLMHCPQSLHKDTKIPSYLQIRTMRMCGFPIPSLHRCMYNWCVIGVQRERYADNGGRNYGAKSGNIPRARCLRIFSGCKVRHTLDCAIAFRPRTEVKC